MSVRIRSQLYIPSMSLSVTVTASYLLLFTMTRDANFTVAWRPKATSVWALQLGTARAAYQHGNHDKGT